MANLNELIAKVKQVTDYSPELSVYNEALALLINDAYNALWTEKRWTFAIKTTFVDIWPDIVPTQIGSGTVVLASVTNNSRKVTFSAPVHALDLPYIWEAQVFEVDGRDYKLLNVVTPQEIHLDMPFRGTTSTTNITWKIKHRFYEIPKDAIELLYLGHRDTPAVGKLPPYGAVRGLLCRRDEDYGLREDYTAFFSECYVPVGTANIPPAEMIGLQKDGPGTGAFGAGESFEICWAFEGEGEKLGPLSQSQIIKTQGVLIPPAPTGILVTFLTFDNQLVQAPAFNPATDQIVNQYEGLRKRIFFNQNFNRTTGVRLAGLPVWREVTLGSTASAVGLPGIGTHDDPVRVRDETATYTIVNPDQMGSGNKRYQDWEGLHFRVRPYPRPIGSDFQYPFLAGVEFPTWDAGAERQFRQWECRYYRKPVMMALQTDQPELPHEFHNLVVYKALGDIFSKHDNFTQAATYQRKYDEEIKRLEKRYVQRIDIDVQRGQFGMQAGTWAPYDSTSLRRVP